MNGYLQLIGTIIVAFLSGGAVWFTLRWANKKTRAETTELLTDTALSLIAPLKKRIGECEDEISEVHVELQQVRLEARHWRVVAFRAREDWHNCNGHTPGEPPWWEDYD